MNAEGSSSPEPNTLRTSHARQEKEKEESYQFVGRGPFSVLFRKKNGERNKRTEPSSDVPISYSAPVNSQKKRKTNRHHDHISEPTSEPTSELNSELTSELTSEPISEHTSFSVPNPHSSQPKTISDSFRIIARSFYCCRF